MLKEGDVHEILHAVALGLAEETNSEPFPYSGSLDANGGWHYNHVVLNINTPTGSIVLCLLSVDVEKGTFTMHLARGQTWADPITVDLMEPDSIEKVLLPMIPMSKVLGKGLDRIQDEKPPNKWANRSIFTPKNR